MKSNKAFPEQRDALDALDSLFSAAIDDWGWLGLDVAQREYKKVRRALAQNGEGRVPDAMLNVELPVRVVVGNNMGITAGCKLRTLLLALARRGMPEWMPDLDRAIRNEYGTAASEPNKGNSDE